MLINFFYTVMLVSAILMLLCANPINSVLFLILTFLSASNIFFLIGCDFLGLIFIIIYLGAIAVIFLFIVMMINIKKVEGDSTTYLVIGSFFFFIFFIQFSYYVTNMYGDNIWINIDRNSNTLMFGNVNKLDLFSKQDYFFSLGRVLYIEYFFFVVIISLLLLVGLIGAIFLTNYKSNYSSKKQFNQFSRNNKLLNLHIL
jgi:NADH-quinone oxidoreductase subunit J